MGIKANGAPVLSISPKALPQKVPEHAPASSQMKVLLWTASVAVLQLHIRQQVVRSKSIG